MFAYLLKHRCLDREVATTFVRLGLIYEEQKYHNAVFVGMDKDCQPHHAHKRSTNSRGKSFRITVEGSDFRYAFFFLYPNLEYACACGMSFLALDTKGDLARNYGAIAQNCYGYTVSVIDLRNPTRSDGFNFLTLVNAYMDQAVAHPDDLAARAKAEKYAKILSKTIITPEGTASGRTHFSTTPPRDFSPP